MAYKFQLGKARMSGSLEQEGDLTVASGSGADVIGVESSLGSGVFLAQLGYDGSTQTGKLEIADGSSGGTVFSVLDILSGSAMDTLAGSGLAFNQSSGVMSVDIDELSALGGKGLHQTDDHFIFSDAGTEKKITFSNLQDAVFNDVSGDATIADGGALTIADGAVSPAKFANVLGNTVIVRDAGTSGDISAKVVSDTHLLIGNGSGFTSATLSGDVAMTNAGLVTIQANAVEGTMLNSNVADTSTIEVSSNTLSVLKTPNALTAGTGIDAAGTFDGAAARTISIAAAQTGISSIRHDDLKIGRASDHDVIDFGTDDQIDFYIDGSGSADLEMRIASGSVTIYGDLNVQGSTTTIDTTNLLVEDSLIEISRGDGGSRGSNSGAGLYISGSTLAKDITFTAQADGGRLVSSQGLGVASSKAYFVNTSNVLSETTLGSTVVSSSLKTVGALEAGSIASGFTAINVANVVNINSLDIDGATDIGADLAATDLIVVDDGASGANRKAAISRVAKYVGDNLAVNVASFGDANATLEVGVNYATANPSTDRTLTLPASAGLSAGQSVKVKAAEDMSGGNLIIARAGSQTIDGETSIVLESPFAAVELVYVAADTWRVF